MQEGVSNSKLASTVVCSTTKQEKGNLQTRKTKWSKSESDCVSWRRSIKSVHWLGSPLLLSILWCIFSNILVLLFLSFLLLWCPVVAESTVVTTEWTDRIIVQMKEEVNSRGVCIDNQRNGSSLRRSFFMFHPQLHSFWTLFIMTGCRPQNRQVLTPMKHVIRSIRTHVEPLIHCLRWRLGCCCPRIRDTNWPTLQEMSFSNIWRWHTCTHCEVCEHEGDDGMSVNVIESSFWVDLQISHDDCFDVQETDTLFSKMLLLFFTECRAYKYSKKEMLKRHLEESCPRKLPPFILMVRQEDRRSSQHCS